MKKKRARLNIQAGALRVSAKSLFLGKVFKRVRYAQRSGRSWAAGLERAFRPLHCGL